MNFIDNLVNIIGTIGNGISNVIDFFVNLPKLIYNLISVLPEPLFSIITVFISIILGIILAKVVKTFVS